MAGFAIPGIIAGIGALGGLFANRPQTATQKGTSESNQNLTGSQSTNLSSTGTNVVNPILDTATQNYLDAIKNRYLSFINPDLSGYLSSGIANINRAAGSRGQAVSNILAARGLGYSPMAGGALAQNEASRVSDVVGFENQIPLLQNQLNMQGLAGAASLFGMIPKGQVSTSQQTGQEATTSQQTGTSSTNTTGQVTQPGNMLGGLFGGAGSSLAYLFGRGAFNRPGSSAMGV